MAAIELKNLNFVYSGADGLPLAGSKPLFKGLNWKVEKGERVLLIGANGAGKTTLQKIIGGKMMTQGVLVLGSSPFHNTDLTSSGSLSYIGGTWQRDVAFAGYNVPLQGDVAAKKMIDGIRGVSEERKDRLKKVLDINDEWRMHTVSEGQRRRVQLCIGLLNEFEVLLLDEATVDLDVLCRADLMKFLKEESISRGCTIIYATHIFDGLESWPSHLAFLDSHSNEIISKPAEEFPELVSGKLVNLVYAFLKKEEENTPQESNALSQNSKKYLSNNGYSSGRSNFSIKLSSNAVWRC